MQGQQVLRRRLCATLNKQNPKPLMRQVVQQLQQAFDRDWNSKFAVPLP